MSSQQSGFYDIPSILLPIGAKKREEWKVSRDGSILTPSGIETKGTLTSDSSYIVMVPMYEGNDKHVRVDLLVSKTFEPHLHNSTTSLYHLDDDVQNNRLDNLKPMDTDEYNRHLYRKQVQKIAVKVAQYDTSGNWIQTFDNFRAAKRFIGDDKNDPALGRSVREGHGLYKGFVYKLVEE